MEIVRLRLQNFRGFVAAELVVTGHVALAGEPRAGRSDIIRALRRVLDPRSTLARINPLDVHKRAATDDDDDDDDASLTEVEVTLLDLGDALEQLLDPHLEVIDPTTGLPATPERADEGVLGLRLCYRARYDAATGTGEHWVDYPRYCDVAAETFVRAPRSEREAIPFLAVDRAAPLQLRAEGLLRRLLAEADADALQETLDTFRAEVVDATGNLSAANVIRHEVHEVLASGAAALLDLAEPDTAEHVSFIAEDGSTAALLRAIQPALALDEAGPLPLADHGSTATGILAVAEAIRSSSAPGGVVVVDDFGDDLDASAAEYLSAMLRRGAGQVWLSTRRPEVLRSFRPDELVRVTKSHGSQRQQHRLPRAASRKQRAARRYLQLLLLPAVTARTVILVEGPHDLEAYSALAERRMRASGTPPPAAYGMRLVAAPGPTGGKSVLPAMAELARDLGFHVRAIIDNDGPGDDDLLDTLDTCAEVVVRLPERTAVERAITEGLPLSTVRKTLEWLNTEYSINLDVASIDDSRLVKEASAAIKSKSGLHQPWIDALPPSSAPPLAVAILDAATGPVPTTSPRIDLAPL